MASFSRCGCHTCGKEIFTKDHFTSIDGRILCEEHSKGVKPCTQRISKFLKMSDTEKESFIEKEKAEKTNKLEREENKLNFTPLQSKNYIEKCKECIERQREVSRAINNRGEIYKGEMRNTLDQLNSYKEMLKILESENENDR